jgi:membrane-associated protein
VVWSVAVTLIGYGLGRTIPIDNYVIPITVVVVILSIVPVVREVRRQRAAQPAPTNSSSP